MPEFRASYNLKGSRFSQIETLPQENSFGLCSFLILLFPVGISLVCLVKSLPGFRMSLISAWAARLEAGAYFLAAGLCFFPEFPIGRPPFIPM